MCETWSLTSVDEEKVSGYLGSCCSNQMFVNNMKVDRATKLHSSVDSIPPGKFEALQIVKKFQNIFGT
jgi:hypothetical protein